MANVLTNPLDFLFGSSNAEAKEITTDIIKIRGGTILLRNKIIQIRNIASVEVVSLAISFPWIAPFFILSGLGSLIAGLLSIGGWSVILGSLISAWGACLIYKRKNAQGLLFFPWIAPLFILFGLGFILSGLWSLIDSRVIVSGWYVILGSLISAWGVYLIYYYLKRKKLLFFPWIVPLFILFGLGFLIAGLLIDGNGWFVILGSSIGAWGAYLIYYYLKRKNAQGLLLLLNSGIDSSTLIAEDELEFLKEIAVTLYNIMTTEEKRDMDIFVDQKKIVNIGHISNSVVSTGNVGGDLVNRIN